MNPDPYPQIIEHEEPTTRNRFPVLWQLAVLTLVLLAIFSALFFTQQSPADPEPERLPPSRLQANTAESNGPPLSIQQDIQLTAQAAFVWDVDADRVLYAKNEGQALPLASITKLMTTMLAYELLAGEEPTTVSLDAVRQEGSSGLYAGESLTASQLSALALISSSNDAAFELGATVGALLGDEDPTAQFIRGMNIRAAELGLTTMEFRNTTGLDLSETEPSSVGSARDVTLLLEHIISNYPELLEPTTIQTTRIYNEAGEYHEVENTNEALDFMPNLVASKTGFTDLAGGNLTIAFDLGMNRPIIVTVLGSTRTERFADVITLSDAVRESVATE